MKKMMFKKIGLCLFVAAAALLWTTCNVGLGEAVDNDAPTLTVTGPAKASICQGEIDITGTCNDDKGVKSVNIVLRNTSTGASYSYNGEIDTGAKSASGDYNWKKTVNEADATTGKYPLPDGKYVADVTVTDINGRSSGVSSTAFDIDNTAPFFCVTSPNSLEISGSKVYGRSVAISGEIADDHDIDHMSIRVFRTDASGSSVTEITGSLAKTEFSGFETAGGTTIYIAKYFETAPTDTDSDDYKLYQNYKAIYGGSVTDNDMFVYIVPTLTDVVGNTSEASYVASPLKQLLATEYFGGDLTKDSLQTAQLQKIYNGTYTLTELDKDEQEEIRDILNGENAAANTYYCGEDPSDPSKEYRFAATVNSNNSPTYDFNGYENPTAGWNSVNTGGTVTITLKAGRDGWGVKPKTLVVKLFECNASGTKTSSTPAYSSTESDLKKRVLIKDATNKETKDIGTSVTNQSYYVTLPSLKGGNLYLLEAEGKDENDSDLAPLKPNKYGFKVATSIAPPSLSAGKELFYIKGDGVKSTGDYKFRINIKDELDKITANGVYVKAALYGEHISSKTYIKNYAAVATTAETGYTSDIVKDDGVETTYYHLDLPLRSMGFTIENNKNYTIVFEARAKYQDEATPPNNVYTTPSTFMFWVDNKAPELEIKSPKSGESLITENFSSYETEGESASKKSYITPSGTWSDISGSGTHRLWFTTDDAGTPTLNWTAASASEKYASGFYYYENQATNCYTLVDTDRFVVGETSVAGYYKLSLNSSASENVWTEVPAANISQVASQTTWDQKIEITEGTGKIFRLAAVDAVGNLMVLGRTGLAYDFEAPKIELTSEPASNGYYNLSDFTAGKLTTTFTVTDSYKINADEVVVTATKNDAAASSGYTLTKIQTDEKTVTVKIELTSGGSSDGEWKWTVSADDASGRAATPIELIRIVDTVAPTFEAFSTATTAPAINGIKIAVGSGDDNAKWTNPAASWYFSTGLVFNGNINEATSGLEKLSYTLSPAGVAQDLTGEKKRSGEKGTAIAVSLTASGFEQNVNPSQGNILYITATDKAGNTSAQEVLTVNIDQTQPAFGAAYYTYAPTPTSSDLAAAEGTLVSDGTRAMTVYGTVSSNLSGVAGLEWQIAATTPSLSTTYTTASLTDAASYVDATWSALSGLNPAAVTGWKAVIAAADLAAGDVFVNAKNNAGKATKAQIFIIDSDTEAPTINLNTPDTMIESYKSVAAGTSTAPDYKPATKPDGSTIPLTAASVNGTIKIAGNSSDNKDLSDVKVYWSLNGDASIDTIGSDPRDHIISDIGASIYNWSVAAYEFSKLNTDKTKFLFTDGTEYNGNEQTVYIKVEAADKAQNNTITVYKYSVDPDSDRPKITFTSPDDLNSMARDAYILKKSSSVIRGKVEDDDGLTGLKLYYSDNDGEWTELALTSGAFEIFNDTEDHDGKHKLLFKVVDAKGTPFVTGNGTGSNKSWLRPKIHKAGAGDAETYFGANDSDDTSVYIAIDTLKPEITNKSYFVDALYKDKTPAVENKVENSVSSLGLLGGERDKFTLYFYAKDASGLDEGNISFEFNSVIYKKTPASGEKPLTITDSTNPALAGYSLITVKDIDVPSTLASGSNYIGTIKVVDKAGLENTNTITIEIDNDAPALTIINPTQGTNQTVSGGVNAYGTVSGADNNTMLYYALTYEDDTLDTDTATTEPTGNDAFVEIKQKSKLMWYVYFDGGVSTEEESHTDTLNQYLISKGAKIGGITASETTISNGTFKKDGGVVIYLWVKAVDAVGNKNTQYYKVLLDPQGNKPTVSFSYPNANGETMGGEIKVYGGAKAKDKDNPTIKAVFAQIISKSHEFKTSTYTPPTSGWGTLTTDDKATTISAFELSVADLNYLKAAGYTVVKMKGYTAASPKMWNGTLAVATATEPAETAADYGVLASVNGSSWSLKLNSKSEFDPMAATAGQTATTNIAAIRVCSYDGVNLSSAETRAFIVDSDTPQLNDLQLEQFGTDETSATSTASREYEEDIYVTGKWFLTFNLTDGQAMGVVKIGKGNSSTAAESAKITYLGKNTSGSVVDFTDPTKTGTNYGVVTRPAASSNYTKLNVKLPLETNSGCGTQYVYVYFEDASGKGGSTAAKVYKISYDNAAPVLAKIADEKYAVHTSVQQSDGWYSFGSKVSEPKSGTTDQSGFERLAFYFTRGTEIFDPMIKKGATGNRISTSGLTKDSGLYWKSVTVTRDANNLNTLTLGTADDNIHKGGLAKLDGVIYRIDDLPDEKTVTISGSPKIKKDNNGNPITSVSALFAIANVVDNVIQESSDGTRRTTDYGFGYNTPSNDDGDLMVESIINDNTDWTWNASIYSKNIADGPVQIHYVAFDKAGNWSQAGGSTGATSAETYDPPVVAATVSNNAPRIANLYVGTDLNGNNKVDGTFNGATSDARGEWSAPYKATSLTWNQDTNSGTAVTDATLGTATNAYLTAKGMTVLKPEILGGNGKIYYKYAISNSAGTSLASGNNTTAFITGAQTIAAPMENESGRQGDITIQVGDFTSNALRNGGIPDCAATSPHKFEFTFYDETEGATGAVPSGTAIFSGSNTAKATVYMAVSMTDSEEPKATRQDLFWNGAGATDDEDNPKNSIAWNSDTPLGHIDLSADLPDTFKATGAAAYTKDGTTYPAALMDRDSKVSGKIVLRGTVSDNKMLYHIYLKIPAMSTQFVAAKTVDPNFGTHATYGYMAATYNAASGTWITPVGTDTILGNYGIKFIVTNNKITSSKHSANWEFVWDTSYIDNVAATNVTVDVYASDQIIKSAVDNTNGTYTSLNGTTKYAAPVATEQNVSGSTAATAGNHPATLQLDVVPYITGLTTTLSGKGANFARTALGHWPIWTRADSTTTAGTYTTSQEKFTVSGFNFAKGNTALKDITKGSSGWHVVDSGATGAKVYSLNNINNNNAALSGTDYSNAYNRQPNSKTNLLLTDDVYVDVWQLNGKAAVPDKLKIETPTMKINPNNGMIGFAFRYGTGNKSFAMPNGNTNSYNHWHYAKDIQNSVTFNYDSNGATYGTVAGGESGGTYCDWFSFVTSKWGAVTDGMSDGKRNRIELTGQVGKKTSANLPTGDDVHPNEKTKHLSPVVATSGTSVYLAYYDSFNNELRFRSCLGTTFGTTKETVGNFVDQYTDYYIDGTTDRKNAARYNYTNCQIVAQETSSVATGGEYVGLAAKSGAVAMVWCGKDKNDNVYKLWYSYNSTPNTNRAGTINTQTAKAATGTTPATSGDGWTIPKAVFANKGKSVSGEFCKIAFDAAGKVHIAAFDSSSGDVWYAYLSDPTDATGAVVCRVDANGTVGENLTLDVAMDETDTTKAIPVIGYYASTGYLPKIARPKVAGSFVDGAQNGKFTGDWEVSYVPTKSKVEQDNVNVGVWKDKSTGALTNSNARTSGTPGETVGNSYYDRTNRNGVCYGNGSKNAVLGYRHTDLTDAFNGYIETAQLTGDPTAAY